ANQFTLVSNEHEALSTMIKRPGTLVLRSRLNLWQMLHPAVQPGSKLDYTPNPEVVTLTFRAANAFTLRAAGETIKAKIAKAGYEAAKSIKSIENQWVPIEWEITTGEHAPEATVVWHTADDSRPRPFQLRRFFLPWARP